MKVDAPSERIETTPETCSHENYVHLRLRAVSMVRRGASLGETARSLKISRSSIRRWMRKATSIGDQALATKPRGGRPTKLNPRLMAELVAELQKPPTTFGCAESRWAGAVLARHLYAHYGVQISTRQARRLLALSRNERAVTGSSGLGNAETRPAKREPAKRPRPAWDGLNKERALRRIKRLASSGLTPEPFIRTLLELMNDGVPSAPNRPFLMGDGQRTDTFVGDTNEVYATIPRFQEFYVEATPQVSGFRLPCTARYYQELSAAGLTLLEQLTLPHFYRSEGYNQVFRPLGYHHMIEAAFVEHGETRGFAPIWRSSDQAPYHREDLGFLRAVIAHVAHGLAAARWVQSKPGPADEPAFIPSKGQGFGIVLLNAQGVIAADGCARRSFDRSRSFEALIGNASKPCTLQEALSRIAQILNTVFGKDGAQHDGPAPVVRLYSHRSGVVLRLRGVRAAGSSNEYFAVFVEEGELRSHRHQRLRYRWGLSPRQAEILLLLGAGNAPAEIRTKLGLRTDTLKTYLRRLAEKLDLPDVLALRAFSRSCADA